YAPALHRRRSRPSHAFVDQGPARNPRARRRARRRRRRNSNRRMRSARPVAGGCSRGDIQRLALCRHAWARQCPPPFLPDFARAHPSGFGKELIPWLVTMERVWGRMTPEALRIAVRMALVELMLSGCTTAADHHNLFPPNLKNAIDIEVEEATKLGLRMTVTR